MSSFYGKNNISSFLQYYGRINYAVSAISYPYPKPINDFLFGEQSYYGKINQNYNSIIPNKTKLSAIPSDSGTSIFVFNFVANQFKLFQETFKKSMLTGKIDKKDKYLSTIRAHKGYEDVNNIYKNYVNTINDFYINSIINNKLENKITNINDFINEYEYFSNEMTKNAPLTKNKFIKSKFCPVTVSGLVIEIANLDYSVDQTKYDLFINSNNFEYYKKAAIYHGFSIDLNAPWRLVADINSPPMVEAMKGFSIFSTNQFFNNYYQLATINELDLLKTNVYNLYNKFVELRPIIVEVFDCNGLTQKKVTERQLQNLTMFNKFMDDNKLMKLYFNIRNNELENKFNSNELNNLIKEAVRKKTLVDSTKFSVYLDNIFLPKELKESGTINHKLFVREARNALK